MSDENKNIRVKILEEATNIISKDRNDQYGEPEDSFKIISELWSSYLEFNISSSDAAIMMALLKIARMKHSFKNDNFVDLAGYAACAGEIKTKEKTIEIIKGE